MKEEQEEFVHISLDRYNDFKETSDQLSTVKSGLRDYLVLSTCDYKYYSKKESEVVKELKNEIGEWIKSRNEERDDLRDSEAREMKLISQMNDIKKMSIWGFRKWRNEDRKKANSFGKEFAKKMKRR